MTTDAEDRSTWPRNGHTIRRDELLRLIEENGGPNGLDLRGAVFVGEGPDDSSFRNPIDLSPDALALLGEAYRHANGGRTPSWLDGKGGIALSGARLQRAELIGAHLQRATLHGAQLEGAVLIRAELQEAKLDAAHLDSADLYGAHLQRASLHEARLQGTLLLVAELADADLSQAQLHGAFLPGTWLHGASFVRAHLQRVDMYEVHTLHGTRWFGAHLDHTRMRRQVLGKAIGDEIGAHRHELYSSYPAAREAYLLLKNNFNQIGRYEDASWAYVKEQQMERMAFHWEWRSQGWKPWRAWGSFWRWLRNWAYELLTGYGERPWNAVGAGLGVILAFGVGFWASGVGGGRGALAFLDCLVYSIATFATFNLARPELNPTGRGIEIASSLEAILGIAVLALVVFTVGNRMSRS